jgi:class 3 adenylate cyclase
MFTDIEGFTPLLRALDEEEAHELVHVHSWTGINTGDAFRHAEDYFGLAVSMAARVVTKARGGQILVTDTSRDLACPLDGVEFAERGRFQMKGFAGRHRLYEVVWS